MKMTFCECLLKIVVQTLNKGIQKKTQKVLHPQDIKKGTRTGKRLEKQSL
jgi:hypothetical protein